MKYITAILSGLFIFVCVGILSGTLLALICPKAWFGIELNLGLLSANIPSLITTVIAGVAATHTFRASLHAKTFKLYKRKRDEKNCAKNRDRLS
ncbi:MAG: hypothetical protein ACFFCW_34565 [Candidatus Hodarchaeota archaeon]